MHYWPSGRNRLLKASSNLQYVLAVVIYVIVDQHAPDRNFDEVALISLTACLARELCFAVAMNISFVKCPRVINHPRPVKCLQLYGLPALWPVWCQRPLCEQSVVIQRELNCELHYWNLNCLTGVPVQYFHQGT